MFAAGGRVRTSLGYSLRMRFCIIVLITVGGAAVPMVARAQIGSDRYSSIVVDANTGNTLSEVNADEPRYPASLTKMMTLYMVFEALRDRRVRLDMLVPVSEHAAAMSPSKLGLVPGTRISVQEAILGLITKSANDAAAALGEMLGGAEDRFGQMMTLRARALGMSNTVFHNASGLPDPDQVTTARDLAVLARHLVQDFPSYYPYFSVPSFVFHGRVIPNHDHMLETYPGADGIKTGYIEASGFNLVTSAVRGDTRLIGVVMGAARPGERDIHMASLLDSGFDRLGVTPLPRRETVVAANRGPSLVGAAQAATLGPVPSAPAPSRLAHLAGIDVPHTRPPQWSVQVGAFGSVAAARQAAAVARRATDLGEVRIEQAVVHGKTTWRAQLGGLNENEVRSACAALVKHRLACTPLRPDTRQVASR